MSNAENSSVILTIKGEVTSAPAPAVAPATAPNAKKKS
jgi:hypothetical protein